MNQFQVGDTVALFENTRPCLESARLMGGRLETSPGTVGIIPEFEELWGETWCKILFPEGIGYCITTWLEHP